MTLFPIPYRRATYGLSLERPAIADLRRLLRGTKSELEELEALVSLLKAGDREAIQHLGKLLSSRSADVRGYAGDLFAAACSRRQASEMKRLLEAARDPEEINRAMLSTGLSLCPEGVQLVLDYRRDYGDDTFDDHVSDVVANILGIEIQVPIEDLDEIEAHCRKVVTDLSTDAYYFEGQPVFVGDLTKAVLTHAAVALREQRPFALAYEPWLLADFSGMTCPVAHGNAVDDGTFRELLAYTKLQAAVSWTRGQKYFYRKSVDSVH